MSDSHKGKSLTFLPSFPPLSNIINKTTYSRHSFTVPCWSSFSGLCLCLPLRYVGFLRLFLSFFYSLFACSAANSNCTQSTNYQPNTDLSWLGQLGLVLAFLLRPSPHCPFGVLATSLTHPWPFLPLQALPGH